MVEAGRPPEAAVGTLLRSSGFAAALAGLGGAALCAWLRPRLEGRSNRSLAFLPPASGFVLGLLFSWLTGEPPESVLAGGVDGGLCANLLFTLYGQCLSRQLTFMPSDARVVLVAGLLTRRLGFERAKKEAAAIVSGLEKLESVAQKTAFVHRRLEAFPELTEVERTNLCCLILGALSFL